MPICKKKTEQTERERASGKKKKEEKKGEAEGTSASARAGSACRRDRDRTPRRNGAGDSERTGRSFPMSLILALFFFVSFAFFSCTVASRGRATKKSTV